MIPAANPFILFGTLLAAFFLGSIPFGFLIGRLRGVDLRDVGSGNTGATNAARALGKRAGIVTLILDLLKGSAASAIGLSIIPQFVPDSPPIAWGCLMGIAALFGHCFSPFLRFRGGKGVATGVGVFLVLTPMASLIVLGIFIGALYLSRRVSFSSISAAASLPLVIFFEQPNAQSILFLSALISASLVILRHSNNIRRLLAGNEPPFELGKKVSAKD